MSAGAVRGRQAGALAGILALCILVLVGVNALVAPVVAARSAETRQRQMAAAVPGANVFSEVYFKDDTVENILGAYDGTQLKGHCVQVTVQGFAGPISMLVGVGVTGDVTGVLLQESRLREGLDGRSRETEFLARYAGKSGKLRVGTGLNAVSAISGATRTSRAITDGVNIALAAVVNLETREGEGDGDDTV